MKVQSLTLQKPHQTAWRAKDLTLGPHEVLVKTRLAGICGTDKNQYRGELPPGYQYPFFFGHEGGGLVQEVGPQVRRFQPGDFAMSFGLNDTFAEYFKADADYLQKAPAGLDPDLACLGEPAACALFSGLTSGVQLGDTVAVVGLGFAGQIIAQVAKQKGAHRVIGIDPVDEKLQLARRLGADKVINPEEEDPAAILNDLTGGTGVDVAVEAAGTEQAMNLCSQVLRHSGTLALYSWITRPVTLNLSRWHDDGFTIKSTCLMHHTVEERMVWTDRALRPLLQGSVQVKPLITHRFKLSEAESAFEAAVKQPEAVKIVMEA